jgi:hypothetical protein
VPTGLPLDETAAAYYYKAKLFNYKAMLAGAIHGPGDALLSPPCDHAQQNSAISRNTGD